jgi:hypothetical protein
VKDPFETLDLPLAIRLYAIFTSFFISFAYGRATPAFLKDVVGSLSSLEDIQNLTSTLQIPALALGLSSLGSSIFCAALLAPERNRDALVWAIKGFFGGPITIRQLRELEKLITREEEQREQAAAAKNKSSNN